MNGGPPPIQQVEGSGGEKWRQLYLNKKKKCGGKKEWRGRELNPGKERNR